MKCVQKVKLFPDDKNRRLNKYERIHERDVAIAFCRPMREYVKDPPFYPWLPPEPYVNFDLKYNLNQ